MEASFWFVVSGWSTALSYTFMTSLQLLGWEQNSPCVVSFFFIPARTHTTALFSFCKHDESRCASRAAIQVSLQCSLVMDSSSSEGDCPLTIFNTQIRLTKRCTCNVRVQIFLFCYFCSIKLANAKLIKNPDVFLILSLFRSTEDLILLSSSWTFSAVVVPQ